MYEYLLREGMPPSGFRKYQRAQLPGARSRFPTLPELHDQTGEALSAMQKMFSELTNRLSEMEKLLGAEKKMNLTPSLCPESKEFRAFFMPKFPLMNPF